MKQAQAFCIVLLEQSSIGTAALIRNEEILDDWTLLGMKKWKLSAEVRKWRVEWEWKVSNGGQQDNTLCDDRLTDTSCDFRLSASRVQVDDASRSMTRTNVDGQDERRWRGASHSAAVNIARSRSNAFVVFSLFVRRSSLSCQVDTDTDRETGKHRDEWARGDHGRIIGCCYWRPQYDQTLWRSRPVKTLKLSLLYSTVLCREYRYCSCFK